MYPASLLSIALVLFCVHPASLLAAEQELSDEGAMLLHTACTQCHGLRPIETVRNGRPGWTQTVDKMVVYGIHLDVEEIETLIDYLVLQYGPGGGSPMSMGSLPPGAVGEYSGSANGGEILLPEGEGQALVQAYCSLCHDTSRIAATPRTTDSWKQYTADMLGKGGFEVSQDQQQLIVEYLSSHFGSEH